MKNIDTDEYKVLQWNINIKSIWSMRVNCYKSFKLWLILIEHILVVLVCVENEQILMHYS